MKITAKPIAHKDHRYSTAGDWIMHKNGDIEIVVSDELGNDDEKFCLMIHEIVECYLCKKRGITDEEVTKFDIENNDDDDPGEIFEAPYHKEHMVATIIERLLAHELGLNWREYDAKYDKLFE